jgi:hypothetical protein
MGFVPLHADLRAVVAAGSSLYFAYVRYLIAIHEALCASANRIPLRVDPGAAPDTTMDATERHMEFRALVERGSFGSKQARAEVANAFHGFTTLAMRADAPRDSAVVDADLDAIGSVEDDAAAFLDDVLLEYESLRVLHVDLVSPDEVLHSLRETVAAK